MKRLLIVFCFLRVYFVTCLARYETIAQKDDDDVPVDCINHLLKNIYNPGDLVLVLGKITQLHYPVVNYDWTRPLTTFSVIKNNIAIIHLETNQEYEQIIQKISEEQFFNPTARFMVISKRISSELLLVSSKFYLTDVIFIETVNKSFQSIYTYEPLQEQNSSFIPKSFKYLTQSKNGTVGVLKYFGHYRAPKTWKNSTLNVIYNVVPPYFQCPTCENGIETYLLDIASKRLGFRVNYVQHEEFQYWGSKLSGNYTYILEKLFQRKCDMVLGAFHSKCEEHLDFDTTFSFIRDGLFWLVPRAIKLSGYKRIALVLNFETYFVLLAVMIIVPLIGYLLYKKHVLEYFFVLYQTLFEVALPRPPVHKLMYFHIIIPFLIVSTIFKGCLIHVLSVDHYEHQINSLEDIVASNLTINMDHDIAQYFKNDDPLDRYVYQRYEYCLNHRDCINRTAFKRDVVTVDIQRAYEYQLPNFYVDSDGKPLLYLFSSPISPLYIHWYLVKGFPIFSQIDYILLRLKSSGIIHHFCDKVIFKAKVDMRRKIGIASNILGLKEVLPLFVLISLGYILGLIAFFIELCTIVNRKKCRVACR